MYYGLSLVNAYDLRRDEAEFVNDFKIHKEKKDVQGYWQRVRSCPQSSLHATWPLAHFSPHIALL